MINNAGTLATQSPIPACDFDQQDDWSLSLYKAAADALRNSHGAVVNTVSVSAFGGGSSSAYCLTKAALVALTRVRLY